jgi:hypothetical protein
LIGANDGHESQRPQCLNVIARDKIAERPARQNKTRVRPALATPAAINLPMRQELGCGDGWTLSVVSDMPRMSPTIMINAISSGVRIAWPVMSNAAAMNRT